MKRSHPEKLLLTVIAAVGIHLLFLLFTPALHTAAAEWDIVVRTVLEILWRVLGVLLPAGAAKALSGVGLRKKPERADASPTYSPLAVTLAGIGALLAVRRAVAWLAALLTCIGLPLPGPAAVDIGASGGVILAAVTAALVPAVCEELFYRRLLLQLLLPFGRSTAILFTALLFGIMHTYPASVLYAAAAGIVLAVCALSGSSLPGCILIHLTADLLTVLEATGPASPQWLPTVLLSAEILLIAAGILSLLSILFAARRRRESAAAEISK